MNLHRFFRSYRLLKEHDDLLHFNFILTLLYNKGVQPLTVTNFALWKGKIGLGNFQLLFWLLLASNRVQL